MKQIALRGWRDGKPFTFSCSQLVLGSANCLCKDRREEAFALLDAFFAAGGNTFDVARHYRASETVLGDWIAQRGLREQVQIATKGGHPTREEPDRSRISPPAIDEDIFTSLEQLQTDYIDLYALHRDDPSVDVSSLMSCLHEHVLKGRIRAIGVSNWSQARITEAQNFIARHGLTPLSFNSPQLSLAQSRVPRWPGCVSAGPQMQHWHQQTQLPLIAWSSQAGGFFSGLYGPDRLPEEQEMVDAFCFDDNWQRLSRAQQLAQRKNVNAINIALAWVLARPFPCAAIIGPETPAELADCLRAAALTLTAEELNWLETGDKA
ncbi:MAG: aldo/keto reductase [Klebsiella huaxiensis]|uniref:aldo/keto reductase n=1 Tax=Klebsiella huaxiensis TaxID=2153354 RepID=UPI0026E94B91|nr:aldo/keto reductase [Klebsiella huaxiensis]WEJ90298.1 MAG: aldo/keto reductase [Klebsiella huaxiensis]